MPRDTYLTKTATTSGATVPTGIIVSGGSAVDEIDLNKAGLVGVDCVAEVIVTSMGTATSLATTLLRDTDTNVSGATTYLTFPVITAVGVYQVRFSGPPSRYLFFSCTASGGDSAVIECSIKSGGDSFRET